MSANDQDHTGAPHDDPPPTPAPINRRRILAGLGLGLAGVPATPRDPAKAAGAKRAIDKWREAREADRGSVEDEAAASAAGQAICEYLGLDRQTMELFAVEYDGYLVVVEPTGTLGRATRDGEIVPDPRGLFGAVIDEVELSRIGRL